MIKPLTLADGSGAGNGNLQRFRAYMWSQMELLRISGQAVMGDRVERAFFNAAPATVSRDFTNHVYMQTASRITPAGGERDYKRTHWPLCCTASLNRFLPNYVTTVT